MKIALFLGHLVIHQHTVDVDLEERPRRVYRHHRPQEVFLLFSSFLRAHTSEQQHGTQIPLGATRLRRNTTLDTLVLFFLLA